MPLHTTCKEMYVTFKVSINHKRNYVRPTIGYYITMKHGLIVNVQNFDLILNANKICRSGIN